MGDNEDNKEEQEPVDKPRKTIKYMTKYERARILGTRALQIRFVFCFCFSCGVMWVFGLAYFLGLLRS